MTIPEEHTYWLSFTDADRSEGQQFLGVIVTRAWSLKAAITWTHVLGINPGGGVLSIQLDQSESDQVRQLPRDQLLSRAQLEQLGIELTHPGDPG